MTNTEPDEIRSTRNYWIAVIAIFAILLLLPPTSWITRQDIGVEFSPPHELNRLLGALGAQDSATEQPANTSPSDAAEITANYPNDYLAQLGLVLESGDFRNEGDQLLALTSKFPNQPGLYAHILRSYFVERVRSDRPEANILGNTATPMPQAPTPSDLAAVDTICQKAEALDPTNAFFPFADSVSLFDQHRDSDAIASIEKASRCTKYEDYIPEEVDAKERIDSDINGNRSALHRILVQAPVLLPHLSAMRTISRVATYIAITDEQQGQIDQGCQIRMALIKIGSLMRAQGTFNISSLVGIAIENTAMTRPGGAVLDAFTPALSNGQRTQAFTDHLTEIDHPTDAAWVTSEIAASTRAKTIMRQGMSYDVVTVATRAPIIVASIGAILFANIGWLIMIALIAQVVSRQEQDAPFPIYLAVIVFLIQAALTVNIIRWGHDVSIIWGILQGSPSFTGQTTDPSTTIITALFVIAAFLPMIGLIVLCRPTKSQTPIEANTIAYRSLVAATVLACLFAVTILTDTLIEARSSAALEQSLHSEGQFIAAQIGQKWPGPTP